MSGIWLSAFILQWLLLGVVTVLLAGLLRYLAAFQERMQLAAPVTSVFELGQKIVDFQLPDAYGVLIRAEEIIRKTKKTVILLGTLTCSSCRTVFLELDELSTRRDTAIFADAQIIVLLAGADSVTVSEILAEYPGLRQGAITVLLDSEGRTTTRFGATSFPTGLCVDQEGHVLDQSRNPHASWLYKILGETPPVEPLRLGRYEHLVTPAVTLAE
ncbi:MAG: TlpA family protein disulfide reductase [Chloroflexota bacterium]